MGAILISAFMLLGFVVSVFFVNSAWKYYSGDWLGFNLRSLRSENALSRVWPTDDGFNSLKFSLARHMIVGFITVVVMNFFSDSFATKAMPSVTLLYAMSKLPLYSARKRSWKICGAATQEMLNPVKKACFVTVVYGFYVFCLSMVFYGIRP